MPTKLTLSIDKSVIESAKIYAKSQGRSLSNLVEDYLKSISGKETDEEASEPQIEISPLIKSLRGSVKCDVKHFDYKEILKESLMKKHMK